MGHPVIDLLLKFNYNSSIESHPSQLCLVLVAGPPLLPVEQQEVDHLLRVVRRVQQRLDQLLLVLFKKE